MKLGADVAQLREDLTTFSRSEPDLSARPKARRLEDCRNSRALARGLRESAAGSQLIHFQRAIRARPYSGPTREDPLLSLTELAREFEV